MANIFQITSTALGTITPAVTFAMDDLIGTGTLPDTYITYFLVDGVGVEHADNAESARVYRVQVNIMNKDGLASLPDVDTAMLAAGFAKGSERELQKDSTTSHYGLAKDYFYLT